MRKRIIPLICIAIIAAIVFPQKTPVAHAEESPPAASFVHNISTAFFGKPDAGLLRSTLIYLFPEEVLKLNHQVATNYASDPNTTYQQFLSYQDQMLYWSVGRKIIKHQLIADVSLYQDMMLRHPMFLTLGYRSLLEDEVGAYKEMYMFVHDTLNPYEQF